MFTQSIMIWASVKTGFLRFSEILLKPITTECSMLTGLQQSYNRKAGLRRHQFSSSQYSASSFYLKFMQFSFKDLS